MFEDILDEKSATATAAPARPFDDILDDQPTSGRFDDITDGFVQRDIVQPLKEVPKAIVRAPVDFSAKVGAELPAAWDKGTADILDSKIADLNDRIRVGEERIAQGRRVPGGSEYPQPGWKNVLGIESTEEFGARQRAFENAPTQPDDLKLIEGLRTQKAELEAQRAKAEADRASWAGTAESMKVSVRKGWLAEPADPSMPTRIVQGTFGAWPEWALMGATSKLGVGGRTVLPLLNAVNQEAAVGTGAQEDFSYRDLSKAAIEGLILDKAHFIQAPAGSSRLRQAAMEVLDTVPQSQLVTIPEIADRLAKGEAITPDWLVENALTSLGTLLIYKSTYILPKVGGGLKDVAAAKYEARVPMANAEMVSARAEKQYGAGSVSRPDGNTVIVQTPQGKMITYQFVSKPSELTPITPEAFFDSVRADNPKEADAFLEGHGGDKKAAGEALQAINERVGSKAENVLISVPGKSEKVKTDVLVQLVTGKAKIGDLSEENFHALVSLTGMSEGTGMNRAREEELARAVRQNADHPVADAIKNFAARVVNTFSGRGETLRDTALRMQKSLQGDANAIREPSTATVGEQPGRPQGFGQAEAERVQPEVGRPEPAGAEGVTRPEGKAADGKVGTPLSEWKTAPQKFGRNAPLPDSLSVRQPGMKYRVISDAAFNDLIKTRKVADKSGETANWSNTPLPHYGLREGHGYIIETSEANVSESGFKGQDASVKRGIVPAENITRVWEIRGDGNWNANNKTISIREIDPRSVLSKGPQGETSDGTLVTESVTASVRRKTHQTAERVSADGMLGPDLSQKLKADEAAMYQPQKLKDIAERASQTPDAELEARLAKLDALGAEDSPANDLGALLVEKINRQRAAGDTAGAYDTGIRASKNYGAVAQILRQAALLNTSTPEGMAQVAEVIAEKAGHKVTPAERQSLTDLAGVDIAARSAVKEAEEGFLAAPSKVTATRLDAARAAAEKANRRFVDRSVQNTPKSWADIVKQTMQGGVLTPVSEVANIVGNIVNNPLRGTAQAIGATAEGVLRIIGAVKRRTIGQPVADVGQYMKGFGRGSKDIIPILMTGSPKTDLRLGGEVQQGFQPGRAWVRQLTTAHLSANERAKLLVEGTLGVVPTVMLRPLGAMDSPFRQAAYQNALSEIGRLKVANGELTPQSLKSWMKVPDKQAKELAEQRAKEAIYQGDEGLIVNVMTSLSSLGARRLGRFEPTDASKLANALLWRPIMLFAKTPGNILQEGNAFLNPVYSFGRMMVSAKQSAAARSQGKTAEADSLQRQAFMSLGYTMVGIAMYSAAAAMARAGILSGRKADDKERDIANATMKPNRLNKSALRRLLRGEDPTPRADDETIDYRNLGYFGMALNITANGVDDIWKQSVKAGAPIDRSTLTMPEIIAGSVPSLFSATLDLAMMKGSYSLLQAVSTGNYERWIPSYFETVSSMALPNSLKVANRVTTEYMPETRSDSDNRMKWSQIHDIVNTIKNQVRVKALYVPNVTPNFAKDLPLRVDAFGRPIPNTPPGRDPWAYHFVDVFKGERITDDPVTLELRRLYEATGDKSVIPSDPPRIFRAPGETKKTEPGRWLNDREYAKYKQMVLWSKYSTLGEVMRIPEIQWPTLSDEEKVAVIKAVYSPKTDEAYLPMREWLNKKR